MKFILMDANKSIEAKSLGFTVLEGEFRDIRDKNFVRRRYEKRMTSPTENRKCSFGDDFENLHDYSVHFKDHSPQIQESFIFQKMTKSNILQLGPFVRPRRIFPAGRKARRFPAKKLDDDAENKFIQSRCSRMTFFIQKSDS